MSKPVLTIDLRGPDGNVYMLLNRVADALKKSGQGNKGAELKTLALQQHSYEAVLELCQKYADVTFIRCKSHQI